MPSFPPCRRLGRHCRELQVRLKIADFGEDDAPSRDALATWLLGHTQRLAFGAPYRQGRRLMVDAVIRVPCKYLREEGAEARCAAHGFRGPVPEARSSSPQERPWGADGVVSLVYRGRPRTVALQPEPTRGRALPVLEPNPCAGAPCRTADHVRGAACCRDLTLDVWAPADDPRSDRLEALLKARRSPYLCKTERADERIIECEVISACGYLGADRISCLLHGRLRPDGRPAKPFVCSEWPNLGPDDTGHPGCRLLESDGAGQRHGGRGGSAGDRCPERRSP